MNRSPNHPLPLYHRGQGLLLIARLMQRFEHEMLRTGRLTAEDSHSITEVLDALADQSMNDLTAAADLLEDWGMKPEAPRYRNFHLIATLLGQGQAYNLSRRPGPAASRLQSARKLFPNYDLFFREYLFAKCYEEGLHRRYGDLLMGDGWPPLRDRIEGVLVPPSP